MAVGGFDKGFRELDVVRVLRSTLGFLRAENTTPEERILSRVTSCVEPKKSVLFFNHHKCASTFATDLLGTLSNECIRHFNYSKFLERSVADYAARFANHEEVFERYGQQLFQLRGGLYGPLRRPFWFPGIEEFPSIMFLRDPRDAIVSFYYSMAYSHRPPPNWGHRDAFDARRNRLRGLTVEEYALNEGKAQFATVFRGFHEFCESARVEPLIVTYDEYRANPDDFVARICRYCDIVPTGRALALARAASRQGGGGMWSHQRSGSSGQFAKELSAKGAERLTAEFEPYLKYFALGEFG